MRVLVWQSYGEIDVYDISTIEQILAISQDVISCLDGWGVEEQIQEHKDEVKEELDKTIVLENATVINIYKSIKFLLSNVGASDHEAFEKFQMKELK